MIGGYRRVKLSHTHKRSVLDSKDDYLPMAILVIASSKLSITYSKIKYTKKKEVVIFPNDKKGSWRGLCPIKPKTIQLAIKSWLNARVKGLNKPFLTLGRVRKGRSNSIAMLATNAKTPNDLLGIERKMA